MKKSIFLSLIGFAFLSANETSSLEMRMQQIDQELVELKKQLSTYRTEVMRDEMQAQNLMLDEWRQSARKIEEMEENQKKVYEIKKKIKELELQRESLHKMRG